MVIDFPRNNMKCSGENEILRGIFHVVSRFPLHLHLHVTVQCTVYRGNFDYFLESAVTAELASAHCSTLHRAAIVCSL